MIENNYAALKAKIEKACLYAKREVHAAELIAVTKTIEMARIEPLIALQHRHFGENYVQEAKEKWEGHKSDAITLHLIGALQSNKAVDAVALFDVIQTLDRLSLATAIKKASVKLNKMPKLFVQVNIGLEPQKGGVMPQETAGFIAKMSDEFKFEIEGLMCIPPDHMPPSPYFAQLNMLAKNNKVKQLSMGMSSDYESAINMGATFVRVGSALFGARPQKV